MFKEIFVVILFGQMEHKTHIVLFSTREVKKKVQQVKIFANNAFNV